MAVGTPAYMSPEQASGEKELDARTDVYALGCVLYELLAGEPPFTGPTAHAIIARALTETPRPINLTRPGVPVAVDQVIARAMAVTPADRYPSTAEFARALEPVSLVAPSGSVPAAPRRSLLLQRPLFAALLLGVLIGLGVLFAWQHNRNPGATSGVRLLAVLPFENQGAPEDEYFADGITDEVRGKLAALPGLQVIARGSSIPYKKTIKTPRQIAQELGVQYLLTATVRWEKLADGTSKVHVSPELVEVGRGEVPTTKWQQPFDAALTDVFQVQADIAGRVAQALNLALGDSVRQQLAERPTRNIAAYDAYLRAEEISQSLGVGDPGTLRASLRYYEQAVALDSTFVQAWAHLSRLHSLLYANSIPSPAEAGAASGAADRVAALAPGSAEAHLVTAYYYALVTGDNARALEEFTRGRELAPNNADLLTQSSLAEQSFGHWEEALAHLQQAQALDPRSVDGARRLARTLLWLRRYRESLEAVERGLALAPDNLNLIEGQAMAFLAQGDLSRAQAVLRDAQATVPPPALVAYMANFWDLFWVLDDEQQGLLLRLAPSAFDDDRGVWGLCLAQTYALRGNQAKAQAYADSARLAFEAQLGDNPGDPSRHTLLGVALAYLDHKADAIREGERGLAMLSVSRDAYGGPYQQHQLARIYLLTGEPEKALDQLEPLLKIPYYLSPAWLRIDPAFAPLKGNSRFERLVGGG